jgi:phage terminase Nu1 subunit (DNA packaging protein)
VSDFIDLLQDVPETKSDVIHESELCALLGITPNKLRLLARDGILQRVKPARYSRADAVLAYCVHLRALSASSGAILAADAKLKAEKIRVAAAQAEKIEMLNEIARGETVRSDQVQREWQSILRDVQAALLAVPSRVGSNLAHLTAHDIGQIDFEIRRTLEGLADGN